MPFGSTTTNIALSGSWNASPLLSGEFGELSIYGEPQGLRLEMRGSYFGDPPPEEPPGSTAQLWQFEVLELFLLGSEEHYLELEFGPHGHYLALLLHGERNLCSEGHSLGYQAKIQGEEWIAQAQIPRRLLPPGLNAMNFYGIHGQAEERRYLAWKPPLGDKPDFHRLESFGAIESAG